MDDKQIIGLFESRSEQAIAELSDKYGSICRRIACNILKNEMDAEECVNEAYLAVWDHIPPEKPDPLSSYLFRIVRNRSIRRYHANTARMRDSSYTVCLDELEACLPSASTVEDETDAREIADRLNRFLGTLDPDRRILFVRRYWYNDSIDALAAAFRTSPHNISVRLNRIRNKLRTYLLGEGISL